MSKGKVSRAMITITPKAKAMDTTMPMTSNGTKCQQTLVLQDICPLLTKFSFEKRRGRLGLLQLESNAF